MVDFDYILISCEHGGNHIPARLRAAFRGADKVLKTHRGLDIGALELARRLARRLPSGPSKAPLHFATTSRLVVDLNRSTNSRTLLSHWTRGLGDETRRWIMAKHYWPYRNDLYADLRRLCARGRVLHLSIHSFTPRLRGVTRRTDIGVLHDPEIPSEARVAQHLRRELQVACPTLKVHMNLPYRGTTDSFVTWARMGLPADRYLGFELEVNQKFAERSPRKWPQIMDAMIAGILTYVAKHGPKPDRKPTRNRKT